MAHRPRGAHPRVPPATVPVDHAAASGETDHVKHAVVLVLAAGGAATLAANVLPEVPQPPETLRGLLAALPQPPGHQGGAERPGEFGRRRYHNLASQLGCERAGQGVVSSRRAREDHLALHRAVLSRLAQVIAGRRIGQAGKLRRQGQPLGGGRG